MKSDLTFVTAVAFVLALTAPAAALPSSRPLTQLVHDAWQTEQGLPQNYINDVVQTLDGYLWLGTEEGLVRFDGVRFTVFDRRNTEALADHNVQALYAAPDGTLWVGTRAGGVVTLKDGRFTRYTVANGLSDARILAIAADREGAIWIGTNGGGLIRFVNGRFTTFTTRDGLPDNRVIEVAADSGGALWIGTVEHGVARMTGGRIAAVDHPSLDRQTVVAIVPARDGTVWFGTHGGLVRSRSGRFERYELPGLPRPRVIALHEDRDGTIWVGTGGGGAGAIRDGRFDRYTPADGLTNDTVLAIVEDREGSVWFATGGGGLNRLRDASFTAFGKRDGLGHDIAMATFQDREGDIWIGTYGNGVTRLRNGQAEAFVVDPVLSGSVVYSIAQDTAGAMWFATGGNGVFKVDAQHRVTHYTTRNGLTHDAAHTIVATRDAVWIGTRSGLTRIGATGVRQFTSRDWLMNDFVRALAADADGTLWIGTNGGGVLRLKDGAMSAPIRTNDLGALIRAIYHDNDGTIWLGTSGGGLVRARPAAGAADAPYDVAIVTMRDGLADDVAYQILDDGHGYLWLSSNKGISRVSKASIDARIRGAAAPVDARTFGRGDGLLNVECNGGFQPAGMRTRDGRLWFPTVRGAVSVAPEELVVNAQAPPVAIENVTIGDRRLEIQYTALSLIEPSRVRFQYRLDGFDRDWQDAGTRRAAYYTNLPAGDYPFRVRAANSDGVWNEQGVTRVVTLPARFFETSWFLGVCLVGSAILVSGALRLRARRARSREATLQQQVEERTRELREANERLQALSYLDSLTNIPNRRHFAERLDVEWRRAYRTETSLGILMIDIDNFKQYNDKFGRRAGDACLSSVAKALSESLPRAGDLVSRYGGEEFAAVLVATDLSGATDVAGRLRAAVESLGIGQHAGARPITVSIGVTAAMPRTVESAEVLLSAADRALLQAKSGGRNCIKSARPGIQ